MNPAMLRTSAAGLIPAPSDNMLLSHSGKSLCELQSLQSLYKYISNTVKKNQIKELFGLNAHLVCLLSIPNNQTIRIGDTSGFLTI